MAFVYWESIIPICKLLHYQGSSCITTYKSSCNSSVFLACFKSCIQLQFIKNILSFFLTAILVVLEFLRYVVPAHYSSARIGIMARSVISMVLLVLCTMTKIAIEGWATFKGTQNQNYTRSLYSYPEYHWNDQVLPVSYLWLVLPQAIYAVSQFFMSTSGPRFLVAQSPYTMRGLLIGLTCLVFRISSALSEMICLVVYFHKDIQKERRCGLWYSVASVLLSVLILSEY